MKIAFLDFAGWDYTPTAPLEGPLGGTQSAICYLAMQLAANGHQVALINHASKPGQYAGVDCPGEAVGMAPEYINGFDAVIVSGIALARNMRNRGVTTKLMLWTGLAHDQPPMQSLKDPNERSAWDGFVFVSDWQKDHYVRAFGVNPAKSVILRNAISPAFENLAKAPPFFERGEPPVLTYTSTPFRGLDVLVLAFPIVRSLVPGCRLKVFSSMAVYRADDQQFEILYKICEALEGVDYVGAIGQKDLARELAAIDILAYPNTFDETSCIAIMEAMAAGCLVVTSKSGALPETLDGHGFLVESNVPRHTFAYNFAMKVVETIRAASANPGEYAARLARQDDFVTRNLTWKVRAPEWETWLLARLAQG